VCEDHDEALRHEPHHRRLDARQTVNSGRYFLLLQGLSISGKF
jgi:hypothetical protein